MIARRAACACWIVLAVALAFGGPVRAAGCDDPNALITDAELRQVCDAKEKLGKIKGVIDQMTEQEYLPLGDTTKKALEGVSGYLEKATKTVDSGLEIVGKLDDLNWAVTTVDCMLQSTDALTLHAQDRDARRGLAYGAAHLFTIFGQLMGASESWARKRFGSTGLRGSTPLMAYAPAVLNARKIFLAVEHVSSDCRGHQDMCAELCADPSDIRGWACEQARQASLTGACMTLEEEYGDNIEDVDPKLPTVKDTLKRMLAALPDDAVPNRKQLIERIDQAYEQVDEAQKWFRFGTGLEDAVCDAQQALAAAALNTGGRVYPIEELVQLQTIESCPFYVLYRDTIIRTWLRPLPELPEGEARLTELRFLLSPPRARFEAGLEARELGELRIENTFPDRRSIALTYEVGRRDRCGENPAVTLDPQSQTVLPGVTQTVAFRQPVSLPPATDSLLAGREPAWLCVSIRPEGVPAGPSSDRCMCEPLD